jgi:hypothetical protein
LIAIDGSQKVVSPILKHKKIMKVVFGLFLSMAVAPGIVSSFTPLAQSKVSAQRTSSLNMVSATPDLKDTISSDDEVSLML